MNTHFGDTFPDFCDMALEDVFKHYNFLGYDNGDGELSCSIVKYDGEEEKLEAHSLTFSKTSTGLLHVPNILAFDSNGQAVLVDEGLVDKHKNNIYHNFKRCPGPEAHQKYMRHNGTMDEKTYADLMSHSFACGLKTLFDCNNNGYYSINPQIPTIVMVGRPAGRRWAGLEKDYADILRQCLDVYMPNMKSRISVLVLSESNAAMAGTVGLTQEEWLNWITQILDIGSSTIDITTVTPQGIPQDGEDGYFFGGNRLDKALADYGDQFIKKNKVNGRNNIELVDDPAKVAKFRFMKEQYYGENGKEIKENNNPPKIFYNYTLKVNDADLKYEHSALAIECDTMNAVLNNPDNLTCLHCKVEHKIRNEEQDCKSWLEGYRYILLKFCQVTQCFYTEDMERRLILTGGVSNMPEVREVAEEVFKPDAIKNSENPNLTVSIGLARILGNEIIKKFLLVELKRELQKLFKENEYSQSLLKCLVDEACKSDLDYYECAIKQWTKLGGDSSLSDCIQIIHNPQNGLFNADDNFVEKACEIWFQQYGLELVQKLLKRKFKELFPDFPKEFECKVEIPDFGGMAQKELENFFALNIYMFFDEENCPRNPYDEKAVFTRKQRETMLSVFKRHRNGLAYGAKLAYSNGYVVKIKPYQEVGESIKFDGRIAEVASISSFYMPQLRDDVRKISDIVLLRVMPQIEAFVESQTYYLAIHE